MDCNNNGGVMQKKLEAMLGSQLFAICSLQDQLEQANTKIAELEEKLKAATPPAKPEKK